MAYQVKAPWWLTKLLYRRFVWKMPAGTPPAVYLTFDDGPHPAATPFVLQQLEKYDAKATFFCIGKNVEQHPGIYQDILQQGHSVGNHTHNHLNGWKHTTPVYLDNVKQAVGVIGSNLFRPPYGRIKLAQANFMMQAGWKIIMWDVLSGDFDTAITPEKCLENVLQHIEPGSVIVFHDSEKAWPRMSYALPHVLEYCKNKNWAVKPIANK